MSQFKSLAALLGGAGAGPVGGNNTRVTNNVTNTYANLAKGFAWTLPVGQPIDSNGYPSSTPTANIGSNPRWPLGYFGDYVWKWSGAASMQASQACIIRSTNAAGVVVG